MMEKDWPEFPQPKIMNLGTGHLPTKVVEQELVIGVWITTEPDNPRRGGFSVGMLIGERENPKLTAQELEYCEAALEYAKRELRERLD